MLRQKGVPMLAPTGQILKSPPESFKYRGPPMRHIWKPPMSLSRWVLIIFLLFLPLSFCSSSDPAATEDKNVKRHHPGPDRLSVCMHILWKTIKKEVPNLVRKNTEAQVHNQVHSLCLGRGRYRKVRKLLFVLSCWIKKKRN